VDPEAIPTPIMKRWSSLVSTRSLQGEREVDPLHLVTDQLSPREHKLPQSADSLAITFGLVSCGGQAAGLVDDVRGMDEVSALARLRCGWFSGGCSWWFLAS
jgi:hypothetical protein